MLLGRFAKRTRRLIEGIQAEAPEGIGILRAEGTNLYIHYLGQFHMVESRGWYVL